MTSRTAVPAELTSNLSENLRYLRQRRELTQAQLASLAGIPRPTLALMESGSSNPTLGVLCRLSAALQVSIDELLSPPRSQCQVFRRGTLPVVKRSGGAAVVQRLLPDALPGLDIERIEIKAGGRMTGVPHRPGTREYLTCERGTLKLFTAGEEIDLSPGDTVAFQGDQPHSYVNPGRDLAVGFSVIAIAPAAVVRAEP
jgi:XRE family transcriptional regulator, regulator of sulfur utilization